MMRRGILFSPAPGTAHEYSTFGFAILGRVVANGSGMPRTPASSASACGAR